MQKKFIGKYLTFKFPGRKFKVTGIVLSYNDNYTLIRSFTDYLPNGFEIFKNDNVEFEYGASEKLASKIIKLRKYSVSGEPVIPLTSLHDIFSYIRDRYRLVGLTNKKGDAMDVLWYIGEADGKYCFKELTTLAKWRYKLNLPEKECRFIEFDTNYLNSLKLVAKF